MTSPTEQARSTCAIDALMESERAGDERVAPAALADELAAGALVVDTRPVHQRLEHGELPGAIVIDRNVLEWRLDPTSPDRVDEATGHDRRVVIVCHEGYSSTLAAATLRRIGLHRATDLAGGYMAWKAFTS